MSEPGIGDRLDIADVVTHIAHAQDDKDWPLLRSLFTGNVLLDLSRHSGAAPVDLTADGLVAAARATLDGFGCTHHVTANPSTTVDGDRATCRTHVIAYHDLETSPGVVERCTMRGYWELALRRVSGTWLVCRWAIVRTAPWEGSPEIYDRARSARSESGPHPIRRAQLTTEDMS